MELNFDEERERLQSVRAELLARVTVLDGALEALAGLPVIAPKRAKGIGSALVSSNGQSGMSAKARKAASQRMKAYWAEKRRQAKGSK